MNLRGVMARIAVFALALSACGGSTADMGASTTAAVLTEGGVAAGAVVYSSACTNCHGRNAEGVEGLGTPLAPSDFVRLATEDELALYILVGRPTSHPGNTTGLDMPRMGGDPTLSPQDLQDVAAYLKSLN